MRQSCGQMVERLSGKCVIGYCPGSSPVLPLFAFGLPVKAEGSSECRFRAPTRGGGFAKQPEFKIVQLHREVAHDFGIPGGGIAQAIPYDDWPEAPVQARVERTEQLPGARDVIVWPCIRICRLCAKHTQRDKDQCVSTAFLH